MFYCEGCRARNGWPGIIPISRGPCEECGKTADCYETASKDLPERVSTDG